MSNPIIPSSFQAPILDAVRDTTDNLFVNAVAGSGKSATLKMIAELLYNKDSYEQDILACAFNSHIVKDLTPKMPPNTKVCTMHSLGFEAWRAYRQGSKVKVDQFKTGNVLAKFHDMNDSDSKARYFKWRSPISKIISLFKAHGPSLFPNSINLNKIINLTTMEIKSTVESLIEEYDIKMPKLKHYEEDIFWNRLNETWNSSLQMLDIIDFDDMIYLPVLHQVPIKRFRLALFDEFQDMNPVQIDFALMLQSRTVAVGDPKQSIYAFRGADIRAIQNYIKRTNAVEMPLSVCYRCAKSIVAEAKKYVPQIEPAPNAIRGSVQRIKIGEYRKLLHDGDYVLCRCTAPLVSECLGLIREGRKATVKGRDIGAKLIETIEEIASKQATTQFFYQELMAYQIKKMVGLERANREIEIIQLTDRVDTLVVLIEGCETVQEMIVRINSIFSDDTCVGITFCTVHKAKGLESRNVFIIEPDLMPHPQAKTESAKEQEKNIMYVAITRAKENLYWVDGKVNELKKKNLIEESKIEEEICNCGSPLDGSHDHITCGPTITVDVENKDVIVAKDSTGEVLVLTEVFRNLSKEEQLKALFRPTSTTSNSISSNQVNRPLQAQRPIDAVFEKQDSTADDLAAKMKKDMESGVDPQKALDAALKELSDMD